MNEFDLINRYFMHSRANGDDAAIIPISPGTTCVTSVDTLVENRHFRESDNPADIGYKSLAVSISDIAAMGAKPTSFLLSLALPESDEPWLADFSRGLYEAANTYGLAHIGGDITRGPLVISTIVFGESLPERLLKRHGAQTDDDIYVSGTIGDAGAALHDKTCDQQPLVRPQPRVALGQALQGIASSCIDISDGLAQDLQHILTASQRGAALHAEAIPCNHPLQPSLTAGDDYELCFTASPAHRAQIRAISQQLALPLTRIGTITQEPALLIYDAAHNTLDLNLAGYRHF